MTDDGMHPIETSSNRGRWVIGLGAAGAAIALAAGALVLFGAPVSPDALRYIPADAMAVAELRMDLPGDQLQHVGNLLAHFPGFADQATLPAKIDAALGRLVTSAGDLSVDYTTDIKPWLSGPAFVGAFAPVPGATVGAERPRLVISATTNGAVTCAATLRDQALTHEIYRGLDVALSADGMTACVIDGRQALLGDPATVKRALDAKADGTGMDKSANYRAARAALGGDRLATVYLDATALTKLMPTPGASFAIPGIAGLEGLVGSAPAWTIVGVRAEDDALVVDTVTAPTSTAAVGATAGTTQLPLPPTHASVLAGMVPADTLLLVEDQGSGVSLQNLLARLGASPQVGAQLKMLDGLGGAGALVGWIEDAGVAVSARGTTERMPDVALLLVAADEAAASSRVASLGAILGLAGLGDGVTIARSTINGVAVTTLSITDLGSLLPPGVVPGLDTLPTPGPISISVAAKGRVVVVTSGEAAMTAILNVAAGSSLADQAAFRQAGRHALANSRTSIYVAAGASIDLVKGMLPAEAAAKFATDVAPYVDPIEAFAISVTRDEATRRSRLVITVSQP